MGSEGRVLDLGSKGCETHQRHCVVSLSKVRKREKIRNQYNQAPHLTQDTMTLYPLLSTSSTQEDRKSSQHLFCLFDLILYVSSTIFQLIRDRSSWVEPVLS